MPPYFSAAAAAAVLRLVTLADCLLFYAGAIITYAMPASLRCHISSPPAPPYMPRVSLYAHARCHIAAVTLIRERIRFFALIICALHMPYLLRQRRCGGARQQPRHAAQQRLLRYARYMRIRERYAYDTRVMPRAAIAYICRFAHAACAV